MITIGILLSYLINYAFSDAGAWRWMLGLAPPLIFDKTRLAFSSFPFVKSQRGLSGMKKMIVLGLAVGCSTTIVPLYLSELAPKESRGALSSLNQLMITIGILLSYFAWRQGRSEPPDAIQHSR